MELHREWQYPIGEGPTGWTYIGTWMDSNGYIRVFEHRVELPKVSGKVKVGSYNSVKEFIQKNYGETSQDIQVVNIEQEESLNQEIETILAKSDVSPS